MRRPPPRHALPSRSLGALADDVEHQFRTHVLECWFPRCVDHHNGGFFENFTSDWSPGPHDPKTLVFQARMTWVAATVSRLRPSLRDAFASVASHGLSFLDEQLWDAEYGGFRVEVDSAGEKHSYATAFGIYAAAAVYRATEDEGALSLAQRALDWWTAHLHDQAEGGYFEAAARDGTPLISGAATGSRDLLNVPYGLKSSNTLLHIVEALTELYRARATDRVGERLTESLERLEAAVAASAGRLYSTFRRDWHPVNRTVSYGHEVRATFLAADAREALEQRGPSVTDLLVDRASAEGFDTRHGGLFLDRRPKRFFPVRDKVWWVQAEALNTYLYMHHHHGHERSVYLERFLDTWAFIRSHQLDERQGGWLAQVSRDGRRVIDPRKGYRWKAAYHETRAMVSVADRLRRLAADE